MLEISSQRLIYLYDLLNELVTKELKLLYKRSVLGIAWTLINPLLQLLVFYIVFHNVLTLKIPHYASFFFCGLLVWTWFQNSLFQGTVVIVTNAPLIRQPGFPTAILPVVVVMTGMIHFCLALPILLVLLLIDGTGIKPVFLELPILIMLQFGLTVSLTYILAAINVTFRDTRYTINVLLQMLFYLTPIFYDFSHVPVAYQVYYNLNPIAHLVKAYRAILILGNQPDWLALGIIGILTVGLIAMSYAYFKRQSYRFVEEI